MILDSDMDNEIDDPFALAYALGRPDRLDLVAVTLAPYRNEKCWDASESIDRSRQLTEEFLGVARRTTIPVIDGSRRILAGPDDVVDSDAVEAILEESVRSGDPLVIVAIGAATNVASALNRDPSLATRATVVWLGGHVPWWPHAGEFNLVGDPWAARRLFASPAPFVWVPCMGVASHLLTSWAAMERDWAPTGTVGRWLTNLLYHYAPDHTDYAKELWDVAAVAAVTDPDLCGMTVDSDAHDWDEHFRWLPDAGFGQAVTRVVSLERNRLFARVREALVKLG